jgi:hypothetical protein
VANAPAPHLETWPSLSLGVAGETILSLLIPQPDGSELPQQQLPREELLKKLLSVLVQNLDYSHLSDSAAQGELRKLSELRAKGLQDMWRARATRLDGKPPQCT